MIKYLFSAFLLALASLVVLAQPSGGVYLRVPGPVIISKDGGTSVGGSATNVSGGTFNNVTLTSSTVDGSFTGDGDNLTNTFLAPTSPTFGRLGINTNNSAMPSLDGYQGSVRIAPASTKSLQIMFPGGGPEYNFFGNSSYYGMEGFNSNFRGFQFFGFGYAGTGSNLRDGDVAVSVSAPVYGGSGAALQDLPISAHEIATHIAGPPIVITTWNNSTSSTILAQTNCWDQLRDVSTNGLLAALTNAGVMPYYHMDSNARWLTNTRVAAEMAINYSAFPDSTNFLRYWQTNGFKFALTTYARKDATNAIYVYLTGAVAPAGATDSSPAMTPNSVARDVRQLYRWGFDQIRGSDVTVGVGYHHFWVRALAGLCKNPLGESWWSYYWADGYNGQRTNRAPLSFQWLTPHIGLVDPDIYTHANVVSHDWAGGNQSYPGYVNTGDAFLNWMNVFRVVFTNVTPHLSVGHYGVGPTFFADASVEQTQLELATTAMSWGMVQISTPTNQMLGAFLPTAVTNLTNSAWLDIHQDLTGLQNGSKLNMLSDLGATNVSVWAKQLRGGRFAVLAVNESDSTATASWNWSHLGAPLAQTYKSTDVWTGERLGFYTGTQSVSLASKTHKLILLTPVASRTLGYSGVANGNFARVWTGATSPAPQYWEDGLTISGSATGTARVGDIGNSTTNVTISTMAQCAGISTWSNTIYGFYYSPAGRVICATSNDVPIRIEAANAASNWTFSVVFPATNALKFVGINFSAATNTASSRYLGPNLIIYEE